MAVKELLSELTEYLKAKYSVTGIVTEQVDGCSASAVVIALKWKSDTKAFKIALIETRV